MQYLATLGLVALGSRTKALSERLYALADEAYARRGLAVQGRWFPVLRLLHDRGPQTIGDLATQIGQSHSAVSQLAQKLITRGFVAGVEDATDRRCRRLHLTEQARSVMRQAKPVWRAIGQTLATGCAHEDVDILAALSSFERVLDDTLIDQIIDQCELYDRSALRIVPFSDALRQHFYRLNEAWLRKYFYVEEIDHRVLSDPENEILAGGGSIWFALIGEEVVGTCALKVEGEGSLELTKMAVDEGHQGLGIGRALIEVVIDHFRRSTAHTLFLETNSKLPTAIGLYESVGFEHQPSGKPDSHYVRSDVYMIWRDPEQRPGDAVRVVDAH